jgi:hypothetical protein
MGAGPRAGAMHCSNIRGNRKSPHDWPAVANARRAPRNVQDAAANVDDPKNKRDRLSPEQRAGLAARPARPC